MNYEQMSDFETNEAVAQALGMITDGTCGESEQGVPCGLTGAGDLECRDYCNNPSDAWPIIESIWDDLMSTDVNHNTEWDQEIKTDDRSNPLRAAMIVYLKMKE